MWELLDFVKCRIIIITNWIPIYQMLLLTYLGIPMIFITYYRNKNPKIQPILFATTLLIIWLIQMVLWNIGYDIYYKP